MNVIAWLEFELAYYDPAVHCFNHYTMSIPLPTKLGLYTYIKILIIYSVDLFRSLSKGSCLKIEVLFYFTVSDSLLSLNLLCHSKTDARFMQDVPKAVWSIPCVSVAFFPSLKQNFIAYRSSKVSSRPDCIFEIHQLWNQALVGCIPILAVAVHLNLKS